MINHLDEYVSVIEKTAKEYLDAATTYQKALDLLNEDVITLRRDVKPEHMNSMYELHSCVSEYIKNYANAQVIPKG